MDKLKSHTRNQRRMYRIHKQEEKIHNLELLIGSLEQENQELKKQLEYLRSGEYLNQLKFERDMLQDVVDKMEVSKEDKDFIDMTHRNTELLEENRELKKQLEAKETQQKEFIEWLVKMIKDLFRNEEYGSSAIYGYILSKYKEIIGVKDE